MVLPERGLCHAITRQQEKAPGFMPRGAVNIDLNWGRAALSAGQYGDAIQPLTRSSECRARPGWSLLSVREGKTASGN
jgi:hypothetical protein